MKKFDRIFDSNDLLRSVRIDLIDHGRQRRRFSASGRAGNQHKTSRFPTYSVQHLGQLQLLSRIDMSRDDTKYDGNGAALLKKVATKPSQAGHSVSHIQF